MIQWLKSNGTLLGSVVATGTIIAGIVATGSYVDSRYAYAEELRQYQHHTEETLLLIQLNQLDERVYRELKKPSSEQDKAMLYKLEKQIKRLEDRYESLIKSTP